MATIKLFKTPFENSYTVHSAPSVGLFLLDHYGITPDVRVQVLLNDVDITGDIETT